MESKNKKHLVIISLIWAVSLTLTGVYVVKTINGENAPNMFSDPYTTPEWSEMTGILQNQIAITDDNNISVQFDSTAQTPPAPETQLTIQGTKVNMRSSPGKQAPVIMQLNTGDVCTIVQKGTSEVIDGHNDYWYNVRCKGKTGWVFGAFTSLKAANL